MPSSLLGDMTFFPGLPGVLPSLRLPFRSMNDSNLLNSPTPAKKFALSSLKKALLSKELREEFDGDALMFYTQSGLFSRYFHVDAMYLNHLARFVRCH
mmetsp:Transcript_19920/g.41464  ORF Transcript_19920/g.41464 Transcript_19920/m.41464 type:complete len:98 (-) Transcript_19920:86-379(-)